MNFTPLVFLILYITVPQVFCWDSEDLEVFDVVEEVGQNFYELLNIPENADAAAIKKAFRKLSLTLHPDKNDAPDADIKFRQLVAVHDILKDPNKRSKYNDVLENGLPDWKQAVYYYRRVRKMGLIELSVILFIIITIGQYLVAWAAYFERKYAIEEYANLRSKRLQKRQKKGKPVDMEGLNILPELLANLPKPSVSCTLPVQIYQLCWFLLIEAPPLTIQWLKEYAKRKKEQEAKEEESSEEEIYVPRERFPRRRKPFTVPEFKESVSGERKIPQNLGKQILSRKPPVPYSGPWTDDDFIELIRLVKKYPPGTPERWEKIGYIMKRPSTEIAHMAHKMKEDRFKAGFKKTEEEESQLEVIPKKVKTKGGKVGEVEDQSIWSQIQQKAFEQALAQYPKGTASDRWEKIAKCVPGKTKEECILRYKCLAEIVKKKKQRFEESPS